MHVNLARQQREEGTYTHHDAGSDNIGETFERSYGSFETALGVDDVIEDILEFLRAGIGPQGGEKLGDSGRDLVEG
jgi:hypothetical protein